MARHPWKLVPALVLASACSFSPDGASDGPDAGGCVPGCSAATDQVVTCGADGQPVVEDCPLGCLETTVGPACASTLVPSNVDTASLTFALSQVGAELPLSAGVRVSVDTDTGTVWVSSLAQQITIRSGEGISNNIGFQRVSPTLSVLAVTHLRVPEGAIFEAFGSRALVVLATDGVELAGRVRADGGLCDVNSRRAGCGGAGGGKGGNEGGTPATGCAPGGMGSSDAGATGGGGGGMATPGGKGGDARALGATGGAAGLAGACGDERSIPLVGGGGGGGGGDLRPTLLGGVGGGGGGGLQITSFGSFTLAGSAVVTAVGARGTGPGAFGAGAGGAGAGGAILLEAATVVVGGGARASTAGGGGGGRVPGNDGEDGRTDGMPALGGSGIGIDMADGLGGNGAIDSIGALDGTGNEAGDMPGTGGGGGGLGRIRINTVKGDVARGAGFVGRYSAGHVGRR